MTDPDLLNAHLRSDPAAFTTLVARYIHLVHAAATRQCPAHADDITQAVFLLLAQKAPTLLNRPSFAGWLFQTTQLCAKNAHRADRRRQLHEREAAMQSPQNQNPADPLEHAHLLLLLDDAIASLPAADRELLILRHLQNHDLADIAARFHLSVPAATKRIQRAVNKLRAWFLAHHHPVSDASLSALFLSAAAHHAPATLHIATSATAVSATTATLTKGALLAMATAKLQTAAISGAVIAACLLIGVPAVIITIHHQRTASSPPLATEIPSTDLVDDFAQAYALAPGQTFKRVTDASPSVRRRYITQEFHANPRMPAALFIGWRSGAITDTGYRGGANGRYPLSEILSRAFHVNRFEIENTLDAPPLTGDFVYRLGETPEQYCAALSPFLQQEFGIRAAIQFRDVPRPVIILRGRWKSTPPDTTLLSPTLSARITAAPDTSPVLLYGTNELDNSLEPSTSGAGDSQVFANALGWWLNEQVVIDAHDIPPLISYRGLLSRNGNASERIDHDKTAVLHHLAEQTGLAWSEETRTVRHLFIEPDR